MQEITHRTVIAAPVEKVSEVVLEPSLWATWLVTLGEAGGVDGDGGVGTTATHELHAADLAFSLTSRVVESAATPSEGHHWRAEFDGPVSGWQSLDCEPVGGLDGEPGRAGTLVTAELRYQVDDDVVLPSAAHDLLRLHQDAVVRQTLTNLKHVVEG
jgi:hypothetical protein